MSRVLYPGVSALAMLEATSFCRVRLAVWALVAASLVLAGLRVAQMVGLDVTVDGRRYGEWFDFIVNIEPEPAASQR